jgi:hypothetical protein
MFAFSTSTASDTAKIWAECQIIYLMGILLNAPKLIEINTVCETGSIP